LKVLKSRPYGQICRYLQIYYPATLRHVLILLLTMFKNAKDAILTVSQYIRRANKHCFIAVIAGGFYDILKKTTMNTRNKMNKIDIKIMRYKYDRKVVGKARSQRHQNA
jgi:hypothetical protein